MEWIGKAFEAIENRGIQAILPEKESGRMLAEQEGEPMAGVQSADWKLECLNDRNRQYLLDIDRGDVPLDYVESVAETIQQADYGDEHHLRGYCYAVKAGTAYAGILLIGEGLEWECDPEEIKGTFFYRILGFVIDRKYRSLGIGSWALEQAIRNVYAQYGAAPIVIECHKENTKAIAFYERHGFRNMFHQEDDDYYFIRPVI